MTSSATEVFLCLLIRDCTNSTPDNSRVAAATTGSAVDVCVARFNSLFQSLQLREHFLRGLTALFGIFRQCFGHDPLERFRNVRRELTHRRRFAIDDRDDDVTLRWAFERRA